MTITVLYHNEVRQMGLQADWGFAALIESDDGAQILFDTGAATVQRYYTTATAWASTSVA